MGYMKKILAMILVLAMTLSVALCASAATSPTGAPTVEPTGTPEPPYIDDNSPGTPMDHRQGTEVISLVDKGIATVLTVQSTNKNFEIENARNRQGQQVPISYIGDGANGILDNDNGKGVRVAAVLSSEPVTICSYALKGARLTRLSIKCAKVTIQKDAFSGKYKFKNKKNKLTIRITGPVLAEDVVFENGAVAGLTKKDVISVGYQMSKKEYKKLKKSLKAAGCKAKIVRKKKG